MAAVSIFPDENFGWSVRPLVPAGVRHVTHQIEEGSAPRLQIVCCGAFEYATRVALQRTVVDLCALLEPPHDLVMEASHIDGRHASSSVIRLIAHSIHLSHMSQAAESAWSR